MGFAELAERTERKQRTYALEGQGRFTICFGDENLAWTDEEIDLFVRMWRTGRAIGDIYEAMNRPEIDVDILALWLGYKGRITSRPGGALGAEWGN